MPLKRQTRPPPVLEEKQGPYGSIDCVCPNIVDMLTCVPNITFKIVICDLKWLPKVRCVVFLFGGGGGKVLIAFPYVNPFLLKACEQLQ